MLASMPINRTFSAAQSALVQSRPHSPPTVCVSGDVPSAIDCDGVTVAKLSVVNHAVMPPTSDHRSDVDAFTARTRTAWITTPAGTVTGTVKSVTRWTPS